MSMAQHGCFHFSIVALCAFIERFSNGPGGFERKTFRIETQQSRRRGSCYKAIRFFGMYEFAILFVIYMPVLNRAVLSYKA